MAKVWFSVTVLIFIQNVFVIEGSEKVLRCDQCIRGGGNWCNSEVPQRCVYNSPPDDWCTNNIEPVLAKYSGGDWNPDTGKGIRPAFVQKTLFVNIKAGLSLEYNNIVENSIPQITIYNTTQNTPYALDFMNKKPSCHGTKCTYDIEATVSNEFCSATGTTDEFIFVKIQVDGVPDEAVIQFHVSCACECSKNVTSNDRRCNGHGDFSCGICDCHEGWSGMNCTESSQTEEKCKHRLDIPQCNSPEMNDVACSGNGECDPDCGSCVCDKNKQGWQYFDPTFCYDICMQAQKCSPCLANNNLGRCSTSPGDFDCWRMTKHNYNATVAAEKDDIYGNIWIKCKGIVEEPQNCAVEYVAMKTKDDIHVMVVKPCESNETNAAVVNVVARGSSSKLPVILGVIALLLVLAAVGGVLLWKHMNAAAPMAFTSSDYQNIDPEDCTGVNPLYKSPTTTFTNPQFGKC